jgi:hypothetical protein
MILKPGHAAAKGELVKVLLAQAELAKTRGDSPDTFLDRASQLDPSLRQSANATPVAKPMPNSGQSPVNPVAMQQIQSGLPPRQQGVGVSLGVTSDPLSPAGPASVQRSQYGNATTPAPHPSSPQPVINQGASTMMSCPNCRMSIMPQAKACPYCRFVLQQSSTSVDWQANTKADWREGAFNVVLGIIALMAIVDIITTLATPSVVPLEFGVVLSGSRVVVCYGMFMREDWAESWGRWFLGLNALGSLCGLGFGVMLGSPILIILSIPFAALFCFAFYLHSYAYDGGV